ncbi:MAG: tRNA preQ1(34) S-adenosylmethionine ribosyltransferase-isomerase QueA [Methylobacteriaceae bacterium]|nr:tRNA preQ1(34) S-adenosylmethionine ribosyltransferase-isomerase QueA [Methylobacteriaceae bacterium]
MRVDLFDFELPEERIALRPIVPRDAARLLVVNAAMDNFEDRSIRDLPSLLRPQDALVVNDTRVIPAQLEGIRVRGDAVAQIGVTLHARENDNTWRAFARPAKRLQVGERIRFGETSESMACLLAALDATVIAKDERGEVTLAFDLTGPVLDEAIASRGQMPLPPYIASRRAPDAQDERDYQTIFAEQSGAVAAPTAGLHFTPELIADIESRGIAVHRATLHVGAGTFLPVKIEDTRDHRMHAEWGRLSAETADALNARRAKGGRIVAVGTTALRLLESAADESGSIRAFSGETSIFIEPGYRFRAADALVTNFHLPRSTLFMLVAAFAGLDLMKRAYTHAIRQRYRFYSYGDACLLLR